MNGRKLSSENVEEPPEPAANSLSREHSKKEMLKRDSRKKREQEKMDKKRKKEQEKLEKKHKKDMKKELDKEKRSSRASQGQRKSGMGYGVSARLRIGQQLCLLCNLFASQLTRAVSLQPDYNGELEADGFEDHEYQELVPTDPEKPIELARLQGVIEDMRKDPRSFLSEYEVGLMLNDA